MSAVSSAIVTLSESGYTLPVTPAIVFAVLIFAVGVASALTLWDLVDKL